MYSNPRLINTKVTLRMENITARENTLGAQETLMKVPTKMVRNMAMEYILISMDQHTKDNGIEENATEEEFKYRHKEGLK